MKEQKFAESVANALKGVGHAWRSERNLRIHTGVAVVVVAAGWTARLQPLEWAMLFFAITLVIVCELINTAVENAVDLYIQEFHPLARVAKDVAAGAVLVASINAVITGLIIFRGLIARVIAMIF